VHVKPDHALAGPGWARLGLALGAALLAIGVLGARDLSPHMFAQQDKLEHFAAFAVLAFLGARARWGQATAAGLLAATVGVEWAQEAFTATRTSSGLDAAFSAAGVLAGLAAARWSDQCYGFRVSASPRE
jgi:hypothetical protein